MNRRSLLATLSLGSVSVLSGCLNIEGFSGGVLTVMHIPSSATVEVVPASDPRLDRKELIQKALDRVKQQSPRGVMDFRLTRDEYATVTDTLETLPFYDRSEHGTSVPSGFYVSHEDFVYRLACRPLCSDNPLVDSESPRNLCWTTAPDDTTPL
jgi:hypothetical protein